MPSFIAKVFSGTSDAPDAPRFLSQPSRRNFDAMYKASPGSDGADGGAHAAALLGDAFEAEQCY